MSQRRLTSARVMAVAGARSLSGLTRRVLLRLVSTEPTPFVVGKGVAVVAAGGVEPDSRHRRSNSPSQANPDRQEVTAEPLADVVGQQSEGVYLDLTGRRHVQGEQPCWCAVDEGHPVPQVWSPQVGLSLLVIRPLTGPLVRTADADGGASDQWGRSAG